MNVWVVVAAVFFLAWLQERKAQGVAPHETPPIPLDTPIDAGGNPQPEAAYADFGKPMEYAPPIDLRTWERIPLETPPRPLPESALPPGARMWIGGLPLDRGGRGGLI